MMTSYRAGAAAYPTKRQCLRMIEFISANSRKKMESERGGERRGELKRLGKKLEIFIILELMLKKIDQGVGYAVETEKQWPGLSGDN